MGLTILREIGLKDGLILIIPKCDWSSLLLEIISRIWGSGWGRVDLSLYLLTGLLTPLCRCSCKYFRLQKPFLPSTILPSLNLSSHSSNQKLNVGMLTAQVWLGFLFFFFFNILSLIQCYFIGQQGCPEQEGRHSSRCTMNGKRRKPSLSPTLAPQPFLTETGSVVSVSGNVSVVELFPMSPRRAELAGRTAMTLLLRHRAGGPASLTPDFPVPVSIVL